MAEHCTDERECEHQPWCRINGRCQRTGATKPPTTMERVVRACNAMPDSLLVRTIPLGDLCRFVDALDRNAGVKEGGNAPAA